MRRGLATLIAGAALLALPGSAAAIDYAPVDHPGPALTVPQAKLDAALQCTSDVTGASRAPVLLVHGTGSNPDDNFSWNWEPALSKLGIPWCAVALPGNGMDDIQVGGEYVVNAIRTMNARSGRRIAILGHSQGGMIPRWALRFWPDTRAMVDDVVGFAPSNHGTEDAVLLCTIGCAPSVWQQAAGSEFIKAANSVQETFAGISYTVAYTHTDWVVTPNFDETGSSSLHGGGGEISNVAIQDICPLDVNEHLLIGTIDPVAYALAIDALEHPGPADPARIPASVCTQLFQPGVNPLTVATDSASAFADLFATVGLYPHVPAEPALACYVTASCPEGAAAPATAKSKCKKRKKGRRAQAAKRRGCKKKKRK